MEVSSERKKVIISGTSNNSPDIIMNGSKLEKVVDLNILTLLLQRRADQSCSSMSAMPRFESMDE